MDRRTECKNVLEILRAAASMSMVLMSSSCACGGGENARRLCTWLRVCHLNEVADDCLIQLPDDASPGNYRFVDGLYDLATLQRLSTTCDGQPGGDSIEESSLPVVVP